MGTVSVMLVTYTEDGFRLSCSEIEGHPVPSIGRKEFYGVWCLNKLISAHQSTRKEVSTKRYS